jgi:hypothetical protein
MKYEKIHLDCFHCSAISVQTPFRKTKIKGSPFFLLTLNPDPAMIGLNDYLPGLLEPVRYSL